MVWDMRGRYHSTVWYDIETISFDFYGIVWEICWYYLMVWEISDICRGISCFMQGYGRYTIYRRKLLYIESYFI